ncbi:MAG: ATP-grasp domain-containing protein [Propionibacteriales bacterium]|nr:ATP-grasp domain-containing protein [Propionibacteriales bacterium]
MLDDMSFGTVLVANRGEIAIRVLRAAREAGLRTVAVYSDADREARHVCDADTAVRLGPAPAAESYLSIPAILDAAARTGAEAIHPGYGFLSERAEFARAVAEAGLTFVGPGPDVLEAMGRKDEARRIAVSADVPVVPTAEVDAATEIEFPVLVKAAAGGGGKGMRVVGRAEDLADAVASARREAGSAFGDDAVLIEKYVEHARHIEVQVLGDTHGNLVHLYERDCSTQRRHQKVLEEAPAPTIGSALREQLTEAAVRLARKVGYVNAGTVEFLVEAEGFYFLEMNTRLQVEHPVTEAVTGLDLVLLQFLVAQGEPLPVIQEQISVQGHAIEARVYAEDPYAGFLPQAGIASTVAWPENARVDAALESGQRVGTSYDPMLGKVIAHGTNREAARRSLLQALDDTAVLGLTTNVGFLRQLVASNAFRHCEIDTAWLDEHPDEFALDVPPEALPIAAWSLADSTAAADPSHPFGAGDGWRLAGAATPVRVELDDVVATVDRAAGTVWSEGRTWRVGPVLGPAGALRLEIDGVVHEAYIEIDPHAVTVGYLGQPYVFTRPDAFGPTAQRLAADGSVAAPMPGTVLDLKAQVGTRVREGDTLGAMEAMKMELALKAPYDGTVTAVGAEVGQQVALGAVLFVVDPADDA